MTTIPRKLNVSKAVEPSSIPTGCLSLDWVLGGGGFPRGCLIEIFGPPDCGKTAVALEALAAAQRLGGTGAFLDAEHALDLNWAATLGVKTEALLYATPTATAEAITMVTTLVKTCAVDVIVLDSVAALGAPAPRNHLPHSHHGDGELDFWPFVHGLRNLHQLLPRSPCCVVFLNQLRAKPAKEYGNTYRTPGQPVLPSLASIRIRMERRATLLRGGLAFGSRIHLHVMKSHLRATPREATLEIHAGIGISRETDLLMLGQRAGIIQRDSGGIWRGSERLGANLDEARAELLRNRNCYESLSRTLCSKAGLPLAPSWSPVLAARAAVAGRGGEPAIPHGT